MAPDADVPIPDPEDDSPSRPRGIGLCLSGGGFRATLFHPGAMAVARGPVEFIFSDRQPEDRMREQLSPAATWEEGPARIEYAPIGFEISLDWSVR